ncbi:hypothetical protein KLA_09354 [Cellulophaga geojensis KL-A]|uniref:Uncharacterized protein n=1 Tax=Cellulophaga geojensis KL-A TaxID=1328323 RepID=A0ABN0RNL3_9FLAO|nr:hypothetical protein [Cellulophaga geojensis]EWH13541.1 hypothetical protein KLA_09354 [Cellulophaga geojensis KL-A]
MLKKIKIIKNSKNYQILNYKLQVFNKINKEKVIYDLAKISEITTIEDSSEEIMVEIGNNILDLNLKGFDKKSYESISFLNNPNYVIHNDKVVITKKVNSNFQVTYYISDLPEYNNQKEIYLIGYPIHSYKDFFILHKKEISLYNYIDDKILWSIDITKIGDLNTTIIKTIIRDQLLLILKGTSVICLNIETGKVVWSLNSEIAKQMGVISGEYLYTASNTSLTKIAIASGEVEYAIRFQKEYQLEKLITLYGIEDLTLFKNELWAYTKFGTLSLVCIDKETAYFKKVIPLESLGIKTGIFSFQFYKDKLFIHDHDYTLYIFEKEETDLI